jgi:hypothetical protein
MFKRVEDLRQLTNFKGRSVGPFSQFGGLAAGLESTYSTGSGGGEIVVNGDWSSGCCWGFDMGSVGWWTFC